MRPLGFSGVIPAATGRPAHHPATLLKLYIYGYLNRVQSSRRLEREAGRNVELMWLTGRLAPDHKTIATFRRDHPNGRRPLRGLCRRLVQRRRVGALPRRGGVTFSERSWTSDALGRRYQAETSS